MSELGTQATKLNPLQFVADALGELRAKGVAPRSCGSWRGSRSRLLLLTARK